MIKYQALGPSEDDSEAQRWWGDPDVNPDTGRDPDWDADED